MNALVNACVDVSKEAVKPGNEFDGKSKTLLTKLNRLVDAAGEITNSKDDRVASLVFTPLYALLHQDELGREQLICVFKLLTMLCDSFFVYSSEFSFKLGLQLLSVGMFLLNPNNDNKARFMDVEFVLNGFKFINSLLLLCKRKGMPISASPAVPPLVFLVVSCLQQYTDLELDLMLIHLLKLVLSLLKPDQVRLIMPRVSSRLVNMISVVHKRHFRVKIAAIDCLSYLLCQADQSASSKNSKNEIELVSSDKEEDELKNKLETMFSVILRLFKSLNGEFKPELLAQIFYFAVNVVKTGYGYGNESLLEIILVCGQTMELKDQFNVFISSIGTQFDASFSNSATKHCKQLVTGIQSSSTELEFSVAVLQSITTAKPALVNAETLIKSVQLAMNLKVKKQASSEAQKQATDLIVSLPVYTPTNSLASLSRMGIDGISPETEVVIANFVQFIGTSTSLEEMCVQLYDSSSELETVERLWLISNMLNNASTNSLNELIGFCYDRLNWAIDVEQVVNNASNAHTALSLYVLGECVLKLDKSEAEMYLVDLIHPLFCLLGDRNSLDIKTEAANSLSKLAFKLEYSNAVDMAIRNHDYILDGISVQLNTLNISPSVLDSLASLFLICGPQMIVFSIDVCQSLFVLLNYYHEYYQIVRSTLTVFAAMVKVLNQQKLPKLITLNNEKPVISSFSELKDELTRKSTLTEMDASIDDFVTDANQNQNQNQDGNENGLGNDNDNNDNMTEGSEELAGDTAVDAVEEWKYPLEKPVYEVLEKVCEYCDKLITHKSPEIRLATLTLIGMLAPFLSINFERYLPLVHKVWPEITARLFDTEIYVVEQSFKCLESLSSCAESFVAKRIEDLWPKVLQTYSALFVRRWPEFSKEKRIQNAFCHCFSSLLNLDLSFKTVEQTLVVLRPALLRNEFPTLLNALKQSSLQTQDLLFVVMLTEKKSKQGFMDVVPVYAVKPVQPVKLTQF